MKCCVVLTSIIHVHFRSSSPTCMHIQTSIHVHTHHHLYVHLHIFALTFINVRTQSFRGWHSRVMFWQCERTWFVKYGHFDGAGGNEGENCSHHKNRIIYLKKQRIQGGNDSMTSAVLKTIFILYFGHFILFCFGNM